MPTNTAGMLAHLAAYTDTVYMYMGIEVSRVWLTSLRDGQSGKSQILLPILLSISTATAALQ